MGTNGHLDFKCPNCGGSMSFDPASGKLKCDFCDSVFSEEEVGARENALLQAQEMKETGADWKEDAGKMRAYSCSSCGAELLSDANTAAISCPYCGNNTIVTAQFAGAIRPDFVIPFSYDKKQAIEKYKGYYQKRILLPGSFSQSSHVDEIQGVYVPFWLFNGSVTADAHYEASDTVKDGDYEITTTFDVRRRGTVSFSHVPADASERMNDALMDSVEPYDFGALKPFSTAYLPGFLAERFDVGQDEEQKRAEDRIRATARNQVRETIKHDSVEEKEEKFDVHFGQTEYALLPVWMLTTRWNGQTFSFAMNGQNGKFTGDLPVSKAKLGILAAAAFLIPFLILMLTAKNTVLSVVVGLIAALIAVMAAHGSMKPVTKASGASRYMSSLKLTRQIDRKTGEDRKRIEKENGPGTAPKAQPKERPKAQPKEPPKAQPKAPPKTPPKAPPKPPAGQGKNTTGQKKAKE